MLSLLSVPVTFKEVYTTNVRNFHVNPNWTMTQFIQSVTPYICREFNVVEDSLEIIEAGQYAPGINPEAAVPLMHDTAKIKHKWGKKLNVAFYIRRKDYAYPQTNMNLTRQSSTASVMDDCPVCLETTSVYSRHACSHNICDRCHQHCLSINYTICPLCRQI
jgi:hypothetical protein